MRARENMKTVSLFVAIYSISTQNKQISTMYMQHIFICVDLFYLKDKSARTLNHANIKSIITEAKIDRWEKPELDRATGTSNEEIPVPENQQKDEKIYTFEAVPSGGDVDNYKLVTTKTPFNISKDGELTLIGDIDYESKNKEYEIEVKYVKHFLYK